MDNLSIRTASLTKLRIGTAGWTIPKAHSTAFPSTGSGLARYAAIFNATEINSTFYRPHRPSTFERWHDSTPDDFRFAAKVPRFITHEKRLVGAEREFEAFTKSLAGLGQKLGPLLLQLPPKFPFDEASARAFLEGARDIADAEIVIEPRHETWFGSVPDGLLKCLAIARVGADPERASGALLPGGSEHLAYVRLHGSPKLYFSSYEDGFIQSVLTQLQSKATSAWCVFDNTASGAAAGDAMRLLAMSRLD